MTTAETIGRMLAVVGLGGLACLNAVALTSMVSARGWYREDGLLLGPALLCVVVAIWIAFGGG